ncbi:MAG TPA: PP0621 family protein [Burkholderiales bacterium]|nr:PP0621 family protein [Burkholderiales bacterium]
MAKFLLVIAVFIAVYLFLRTYRRRAERAPPPAAGATVGEDMVRCRICGVHLPKSEAVTSRGELYCSKEHLRLADRERGR